MKLTLEQKSSIAENYSLGKVKTVKLIKKGLQNTNFIFTTSKGKFIVRFIREKKHTGYIELKNLEFDVLNYLKDNNFPYGVPVPIKSNQGNIISFLDNREYFVYHYLEGKSVKRPNKNQIKSVARALATYHKFILDFKGNPTKKSLSDLSWVFDKYREMKQIKPKNELDKIMLENLDYFNSILSKIILMHFSGRIVPAHSDFSSHGNLLFNKDEITGILDFDNIDWSLIGKDLANSMRSVCLSGSKLSESKFKLYLEEYQKILPLQDEEISSIKPLILRHYCIVFWWSYMGDMKDESNRMDVLKRTINQGRALEEAMHLLK